MAPVTKVVVMARGLGSRMRRESSADLSPEQVSAAAAGAKAMMPLGGRPFLDHVLTRLADAGLVDVCLVIGPEHTAVRDYYENLPSSRVRVSFAEQAAPRGTADAVAAAEDFAGCDRFVVVNGDNLYPTASVRALIAAPGSATVGFSRDGLLAHSNIPAERIAAFGLLGVRGTALIDLVEKPTPEAVAALQVRAGDPAYPLISMNCWLFEPTIFDACRRIGPSARGEFEIVDAVRALVADGVEFTVVPSDEGVLDLSARGDVAAVSAALAGHEVNL